MALFRKRVPLDAAAEGTLLFFVDRCQSQFNKIKLEYRSKKLRELEYMNHELEYCLSMWVAVACELSIYYQSEDASKISNRIKQNFFCAPETRIVLPASKPIIEISKKNEHPFHRATFEIFRLSFKSLRECCVQFPQESNQKVEVDGVELASCLRAIDTILTDHKLV